MCCRSACQIWKRYGFRGFGNITIKHKMVKGGPHFSELKKGALTAMFCIPNTSIKSNKSFVSVRFSFADRCFHGQNYSGCTPVLLHIKHGTKCCNSYNQTTNEGDQKNLLVFVIQRYLNWVQDYENCCTINYNIRGKCYWGFIKDDFQIISGFYVKRIATENVTKGVC